MPGSGGDGGVLPDYFRVPVGASWETRVIGRFPKIEKTWNKAENDHVRLSCEVRMIIVLIAVKSCRTPRRGRQHRRARKRGTSPSARVHRARAAQTRHRRLGCHGHAPERRPTSTRRACGARRSLQSVQEVVPSGTPWPSDHPRRPPCHTPGDRIARESHCCCEPPAPKPGDVYAEGRTCLPRSRMGAVPLMSGAGRYSSCHHRRSRQSMTLSITHRIVPSCPRPKG